jgi:flagellar hook assembly protein FlgD
MLQGNSPTETDLRQLPLTAEVINANPAVESSATFATIAPNPISSTARIAFTLPEAGHAALDIMDVQGRRIARLVDGELGAASHAYTWNTRDDAGRPVPSGVYFARLVAGSAQATRRIVIRR